MISTSHPFPNSSHPASDQSTAAVGGGARRDPYIFMFFQVTSDFKELREIGLLPPPCPKSLPCLWHERACLSPSLCFLEISEIYDFLSLPRDPQVGLPFPRRGPRSRFCTFLFNACSTAWFLPRLVPTNPNMESSKTSQIPTKIETL